MWVEKMRDHCNSVGLCMSGQTAMTNLKGQHDENNHCWRQRNDRMKNAKEHAPTGQTSS
jgi:hypothetical protein